MGLFDGPGPLRTYKLRQMNHVVREIRAHKWGRYEDFVVFTRDNDETVFACPANQVIFIEQVFPAEVEKSK